MSTFVLRAAIGPAAPPARPKAVAAAAAAGTPRGRGGGASCSQQGLSYLLGGYDTVQIQRSFDVFFSAKALARM